MKGGAQTLEGLTEPQKKAILHRDGPLLIVAGPGSGKTEVISRRAAHLVTTGLAGPGNLLVTTFTERAAFELKDRIQSKLPEVDVESMQISTIHSFCHALLQEFREQSPFPRGFEVLDDAGQLLFIYARRVELGLGAVLKGRESDFFSEIKRVYNLASEELIDPDGLIAYYRKGLEAAGAEGKGLWQEREVVARSYPQYLQLLLQAGATDFSNLQRHAYDMLRGNRRILEALRDRFRYILIDEYQDTNCIQDRIMNLLAGPEMNVTVVGDDDQGIYRFRGATVKNILSFAASHGADRPVAIVKLEDNFRSLQPIVTHTSRLIRHNLLRQEKNLLCHRDRFLNDILLVHRRTAAEEAQAVARILKSYVDSGVIKRMTDVAILLRSVRSYGAPYREALEACGIPYVVARGGGFFERPDIADLCGLFIFLAQGKPWADRYVRCAAMSLADGTLAALRGWKEDLTRVRGAGQLARIGIKDRADRERVAGLIDLKMRVLGRKFSSIMELLYEILRVTGCFRRWEEAGDREAIRNAAILARIIEVFDQHGKTSNLYPFLSYLKLLKQSNLDSFMLAPADAVQIMTAHQAKGLEFPVVVIGAAMERRFPTSRRRPWCEIPYHLCESGEPEVEDFHTEDERKLFYVASTRARDLLLIGAADVVNKRGGGPSRFIHELLGDNVEQALKRTEKVLDSIVTVEESRPGSREPRRRLSYSQIAYFLQCPVRFKYIVEDGMAVLQPYYVNFGANVHRALELAHRRFLEAGPRERIDPRQIVESAWSPGPGSARQKEGEQKKLALRQIAGYLSGHAHTFPSIVDVEKTFSSQLDGCVITGRIDLVRSLDGDAVEIVDFKTADSAHGDREQAGLQMDLYALGSEKSLGYRVGARTIHYLGDNRANSSGWDAAGRKAAARRLGEIIGRIDAGEFAPRVEYCPHCQDFRHICPYYYGGA